MGNFKKENVGKKYIKINIYAFPQIASRALEPKPHSYFLNKLKKEREWGIVTPFSNLYRANTRVPKPAVLPRN